DKGQNVGDSLSANQLPAEPSPVAWQQLDDEQTPEHTITPSQLEGGQSESQSEAQVVSMELETGAEEAGPSAALNDCLERLSFSPHLAHKNLVFSDQNRRVKVQSHGQPCATGNSRLDHSGIGQVMADQEFSRGVHYWEVDTSQSVGWAIGVAYPNLGLGELLGRTPSSWCLEWNSRELCFWHNNNSEHVKHGCPSKTSEDISEYEELNPEDGDGIEHNLQTLKRKLTDLTSEIKRMDDIISKKRKTKHQRKGVTSASNDFVSLGTFLSESKNSLRYEPSELPEEPLDNMTSSLRLGLECLTHALSQLPQLDIPSQDVDKGQNVGDSLSANQLPAEPSPVAWQQPDGEQTPEHTITPSQLEGGQSESQSEAQVVSMELETGAEEAGPSAALNDCLERLSFSPHLAHKNLVFSDQNRRVNVQRLCQGRRLLSRPDHFGISQVMADQEFSSGVHYWEVDTSQSVGWAIGVAYPNLGHGDKLGRTPSSWCLEWSSSKLCFWHNSNSEHVKHGCPSKSFQFVI
ncbi:hypothetical protein COCON_G00025440, partial [Conger conger]